MNKVLLLISLIVSAFYAFADSFYYSGDKKIPLKVDEAKIAIICKKGCKFKLPTNSGLNIYQRFSDERVDTYVLEKSEDMRLSTIKKLLSLNQPLFSEAQVNIQPCYTDDAGLELTPSQYIYIKLKTEDDYSKLLQIAEEYNCIIVEKDEFMPLWYTLYISDYGDCNSVEIANEIYETGLFSSSYPALSYDACLISYDLDRNLNRNLSTFYACPDSFYYSGDEKIPLKVDNEKVAILCKKGLS